MKKQIIQLLFLVTVSVLLSGTMKAQAASTIHESQAKIIVNGEELQFSNPILIDRGSILLPMRAYFEAIGAEVSWHHPTQTATALRGGIKIDLTINKMEAQVNGKPFPLSTPAILHNGNTYVPLRFVGESLGGTVTWHHPTFTAEVQFDDGGSRTLQSKMLSVKKGSLPIPQPIEDSTFADQRRLLVSDNPERLSTKTIHGATNTLAIDEVQSTEQHIEHRIFGWHVNSLGQAAELGIVIENRSFTNTLTITTVAAAAFNADENQAIDEIGLPLAEASLLNKLLSANKELVTIAPRESKVLSAFQLDNGQLIGFLSDLNVAVIGQGDAQYTIRTVVSTEAKPQLTAIKTPIVAIDTGASHPRGVWPSATLKATLPAFTIGAQQVGYSLSNGQTDHLYSVQNALSTPAETVPNRGHFGASYKVEIPIVNDTKKRKAVSLKLTGRGGTYSGLVRYRGQTYIIPPLQAGSEYVQLPIMYTAQKHSTLELEFIHAGGSTLPLALYIESN